MYRPLRDGTGGMRMIWRLHAQGKGTGESHPNKPKAESARGAGRRKGAAPVNCMLLWPLLQEMGSTTGMGDGSCSES